jgi:hypothetical protein
MSSGPTTPEVLLKLWISIHGEMDQRLHPVFKKRAELHELIHYTPATLKQAFSSSPKLIEILRTARRLDPGVRQKLNRARNTVKPSKSRAPRSQDSPNRSDVLPLPGDPGSTRRPGKKREHYRTGEEAELRHIAKQYKWW